MKKSVVLTLIGLGAAGLAQAQEVGRVISSTPVIQQVAVPRQVCSNQQMAVEQPKTGAGGVMGAIAGGAVGNQIGGGAGRTAATVLGVVGGAILGDRIEGPNTQVQTVQNCTTQTFYENRTAAYNVVYEYGGKQYSVQMPYDPGPSIRLQVTPVGAAGTMDQQAPSSATNVVPGPVTVAPQPLVTSTVVVPPTYAYYPYPYPYPYYRPYYPAVSLNLGYVYHGGHRH
ncbi:MAG: glycine zipper 2TM domain-containing protein [Ramlibacter sp.]